MPVVWAGASGPREPDSSPRCCTSSSWPRRAACPEPGPPDVSRRPSHASAASPRGRLTRAEDNQVAPQHRRATTHGFRVVLTIGLRVGNLESHPGIGVRTRTHPDHRTGREGAGTMRPRSRASVRPRRARQVGEHTSCSNAERDSRARPGAPRPPSLPSGGTSPSPASGFSRRHLPAARLPSPPYRKVPDSSPATNDSTRRPSSSRAVKRFQ